MGRDQHNITLATLESVTSVRRMPQVFNSSTNHTSTSNARVSPWPSNCPAHFPTATRAQRQTSPNSRREIQQTSTRHRHLSVTLTKQTTQCHQYSTITPPQCTSPPHRHVSTTRNTSTYHRTVTSQRTEHLHAVPTTIIPPPSPRGTNEPLTGSRSR